jgi:hypothetical protein
VPAALEISIKKGVDYLQKQAFADYPRAARKNIRVVVAPAHFGGINVVAKRRPYSFYLIGGNRHAYSGAAYQYAFFEFVLRNLLCDFQRDVGIVARVAAVGSEILIFYIFLLKVPNKFFLKVKSAVVASYRNHLPISFFF